MSNTKKDKGKPQITGQLWDKQGNHLHAAFDMGWGEDYWARIKSEAIIRAALGIQPPSWVMLKMDYSNEEAFTKFIERQFKQRKAPSEYLVVKTKSISGKDKADSWFFIHGLDISIIARKAAHYSTDKPQAVDSQKLEQILKELFDIKNYPSGANVRRWGASRTTRHMLTLLRMQHLILDAKTGKEHELTEGVPNRADFTTRLAKYIKHDRPLIFDLKLHHVLQLLRETKMMEQSEIWEIIEKLLEWGEQWELVGIHKGLPSAGAEMDKKTGLFATTEGKLSALSERLKPLTEDELAWETIPYPEPQEDEHLE